MARIPHDTQERLSALKALIGDQSYDQLAKVNQEGREILFTLARIPHDTQEQICALEALKHFYETSFRDPKRNRKKKILRKLDAVAKKIATAKGPMLQKEERERLEMITRRGCNWNQKTSEN